MNIILKILEEINILSDHYLRKEQEIGKEYFDEFLEVADNIKPLLIEKNLYFGVQKKYYSIKFLLKKHLFNMQLNHLL